MATILLSAAGAAAGGAVGGSFLGISAGVIGRAAGATVGRLIDQRLMGHGSDIVERGRVDRFRLTGASEGSGITRSWGRNRLSGQVIWASDFLEDAERQTVSGSKGVGGGGVTTESYSYSVSLAVALCEGVIGHVGRVWADGREIDRSSVRLRVHRGSETQTPDPKIEAIEGRSAAPAYRGLAYVVFEDLDLAPYGNRVPQFSFEVIRPDRGIAADEAPTLVDTVEAVALIPGTGEYAMAPGPVHYREGPGRNRPANSHSYDALSDFEASVDALEAELPQVGSVLAVVSWFGDDLRCGECELRPKVEHKDADGSIPWRVAGLDRLSAREVPKIDGSPVYGGTPADETIIDALRDLNDRGLKVVYYPFILMDQIAGNGRRDPWTGAEDQPPLPWRGRITVSAAPDQPGSPDQTATATDEVAAFFGTAEASDFTNDGRSVQYDGPDEWGMRRFILHQAALCRAAGGVDAFCIGTEMRGITQIRGPGGSFPGVEAFIDLLVEVRAMLGSAVKLSYAADWSEYFGYAPPGSGGEHFFHLDPLWAHPDVDFIGIDNYMPLSDWRDGDTHLDAQIAETIYDLDYLRSNVAGGEGYDWYYPDAQAVEAQLRVPITDGAYGEPWVYRYKDIRNWWENAHHDRPGGVRSAQPTAWVPRSKPIWFTELGCAAIDKGTNQPNKFLDPKSSESVLPRFSDGTRDDLIQMQYLRAVYDYWNTPENNPAATSYDGRMIDMSRAHVWTWDARPYPWFPGLDAVWSDGPNYIRGHWLNGRTGSQLLSSVVREVCAEAGLAEPDVSRLYGLVRGYATTETGSARAILEPLMVTYGFDAYEREGQLIFRNRTGRPVAALSPEAWAQHPEQDSDVEHTREADAELSGRVRLSHIEADGDFEIRAIEAALPGSEAAGAAHSEVNLVLTAAEARQIAERWLTESRVSRDTLRFALPLSRLALGAGDVVSVDEAGRQALYRIDRCEQQDLLLYEAVRVEPGIYRRADAIEEIPRLATRAAPVPPSPVFLDLPTLREGDRPEAPYLAAAASPWPGELAVYASNDASSGFGLVGRLDRGARLAVTRSDLAAAAPGRIDLGPPLIVELASGTLSSVDHNRLLDGANALAIGDGSADGWEILQFETAELIGPETYALHRRLRGQLGTESAIAEVWPAGSLAVMLDDALIQVDLAASSRGRLRHYRVGPSARPYTDPAFVHASETYHGAGLRPFAPVHLRVCHHGDGGHAVSWIRRTRVDGDVWNLPDVPLGEATELYRVQVRTTAGVRRRVEVGATEWTYTAAERAADGVSGAYTVEVAQISDRFGPGQDGRITVNG